MSMKTHKRVFPKFMENFVPPDDALEQDLEVYRVNNFGKMCDEAFWGTYCLYIKGMLPEKELDLNNASTYSTSCYSKIGKCRNVLKLLSRGGKEPAPFIMKGITSGECGPSRLTPKGKSHIDWWLYEDANPKKYFAEVDDE